MARNLQVDLVLFAAVVVLVIFGLVMVFSASAVIAADRYHFSYYFLVRQGLWAALGLGAMVRMMNFDYHQLGRPRFVFPAVGLQLILLIAVLMMPRRHATHRWFYAGPLSFQPSELAKILLVIFFAYLLDRRKGAVDDVRYTLLPLGLVTGLTVLLVLAEPDLGTSLAIVLIAAAMLFAAGLRLRFFVASAMAGIPALYLVVFRVRYRLNRVLGFLHPQADPLGKGFQMLQSLIAVGSGGILGVGLMEGRQKLFFLPEPQTDFIYAVISEELGFIGALFVVAVFAVILWRGLRAAAGSPDNFGSLLAIGLTVLLVGQALVNMSVVISLLPTKGIPLPFVSYGGSSLLMNLIAAGILLNISQHASGNAAM